MERVTPVDHRVDAPAGGEGVVERVAVEVHAVARAGPLHKLEEPLAPQDVGLQRRHPAAVARLVAEELRGIAVRVRDEAVVRIGQVVVRADGGDVRAGGDVPLDQGAHVDVRAEVPARDEHLILADIVAQIGADRGERVHAAGVEPLLRVREAEGREHVQPAAAAREVPARAAAEVVHQREVAALHDDPDVADAGVHHVGEREVDQAIAPAERERRAGAVEAELPELRERVIGVDQTVYSVHISTSADS